MAVSYVWLKSVARRSRWVTEMFSKKFLLLLILVAVIGLPYLLSTGGFATLKEKWNSMFSSASPADTPLATIDAGNGSNYPMLTGNGTPAQLTGPRVADLGEVFHFGVTPEWIMNRWSRVTTTVGDMQLDGMRVALLTGSRSDDVHGSLTYYFNKSRQLERITFQGFTGDALRLVQLVSQHYNFQPVAHGTGVLYMKRWNGKPTGILLVDYRPVMHADNTRSSLQVTLEINNTLGRYQLSQQAAFLLKQRGI